MEEPIIEKSGRDPFDREVKRYLAECGHCRDGYASFVALMPEHRMTNAKTEQAFGIR